MSNEDEIVKLREKYEELEKKVISLESEVKVLKDNSFNQVQNREQEQKIGHNYVKQNTNTIKEEPAIGKQEQKIESNYTPKTKNTNNIQVETKIGKQVMSIIASVLIFFSLILFARVIYTYLTDGMKVAFMYLLSIGFLSLGLVKMNKQNKYYLLFTSIAGCGIGALYISNVISYFIFHILNKYVLFFLIFVWIVGVAYLSTKKSQVFMIICYIGILLSTLLCIIDNYKSILAIVCYLLGISILFIFNYSKNINRDIFYFIQYPIVIAVISLVYYNQLEVNIFIAVTVLSLYIGRNYLYKETPKDYCIITLLLSIGTLILNTSIVYVNWERIQSNFFVWVISLVLVVWSIYKYNRGLLAKIPYYIVIVLLPLLPYGDIYINYVLYIPFIILYLVLGYIGKSFTTELIGVIYVILYAINYPSKTPMIVAYSIIFIALVSYVIYTYVYSKNENIKDKYVIFIGFLSILLTLNNDIERELLFIAYVLLSIYINSSYFKVK